MIRAKFDPSRRGQSGILRQAVKARKPVPQEKLLEQIDINCDGSISYQRQGLTKAEKHLKTWAAQLNLHPARAS